LHSLFSGKDRDLKIQRQRVLYRGLTNNETRDSIYTTQRLCRLGRSVHCSLAELRLWA